MSNLYELWSDTNNTLYSSVFSVAPGNVCVLYAADFPQKRVRTDAAEISGPVTACIRRLLFGFTPDETLNLTCSWIFDTSRGKVDKLVDQIVTTCNGVWQLSMCRNIGIIGVPGSYRLELNDATVIGKAQVYAETYSMNQLPLHVKDLFFL